MNNLNDNGILNPEIKIPEPKKENQEIEVSYLRWAGFWDRVLADILNLAFLYILFFSSLNIFYLLIIILNKTADLDLIFIYLIILSIFITTWFFYIKYFFLKKEYIGNKILNIELISDITGKKPHIIILLLRNFFQIIIPLLIFSIVFHTVSVLPFLINYSLILYSRKKQTLTDKMFKTVVVVKKEKDWIKIMIFYIIIGLVFSYTLYLFILTIISSLCKDGCRS